MFKNFIVNENIVRKIKTDICGIINNKKFEDIYKSLKINNNNRIIEIYPVNIETKNKENEIIKKEQNIILISEKEMIKYLDDKKAKLYGLDFTFHIIPRIFKPYKLMDLYAIEPKKKLF